MNEPKRLLNPSEMAKVLCVPVSWIYRQTMITEPGSIPVIRVGKYLRFEPDAVIEWLKKRNIRNE